MNHRAPGHSHGWTETVVDQQDRLLSAAATRRSRAESADGAVAVEATADGLIHNWHIGEELRGTDVREVVAAVVRLQHEAVADARAELAAAAAALREDPRFRAVVDRHVDAIDRPVVSETTPDNDGYFAHLTVWDRG
ncbi:hypothetical protein AB4Z09_16055 [Rhodococcus sp. TAF43]|uniref:hypothetical protein n=1 Tax=Rhodococcus sp. TAF43 TaxID=3237483 RepID=UPI003F961889